MNKIPYDKDKFIEIDYNMFYEFSDNPEPENLSGILELFCPFCGQKQKFDFGKLDAVYIERSE